MTKHYLGYGLGALVLLAMAFAWLRAHDAWKEFQGDLKASKVKIDANNTTVKANDATVATAQKTVAGGVASNAAVDAETKQKLADLQKQLNTKPDAEQIKTIVSGLLPGAKVDTTGGKISVDDTPENRDLINKADVAFKTCRFSLDSCAAQAKTFNEIIVPGLNTQIQALTGTVAAQKSTIDTLNANLKHSQEFGKGGNIWSRTGRVLLPIACAGAGAYLGANKGTKGAAVGALAGGGVCAVTFHF